MPFGESFLTTIKSNKSIILDKSRRFRKTTGGYDWSKSQQFNFPKATPEQLKQIRESMQKNQKQIRKKQVFAFLIIVIALFFLYMYS